MFSEGSLRAFMFSNIGHTRDLVMMAFGGTF